MKSRLFIILLLLLPATISFGQQTAGQMAVKADSAYAIGNYGTAAALYQKLITEVPSPSADIYYNLGNAHYRMQEYGPAILNYERARRLDPAMKDARQNLALANSKTIDHIEVLPKPLLSRWFDSLCTDITPHAWRIIWLVVLALTCLSVVLFFLISNLTVRKSTLIAFPVFLLLLIFCTIALITSTNRLNDHSAAIVMEPAINVKNSPEAQSTDKLILHEGTKVTIDDSIQLWYKIILADGTDGWCNKKDVERI
ncbi:MAG: tetratricopeptide repeat protein [Bacteroidales bacterium]|nr:tetratricopeptide repeat protein [Bacteroidales bacterium]